MHKLTLSAITLVDSIRAGHTDVVSNAERPGTSLRATVSAIPLCFYLSPLIVATCFADERITRTLLFVFGESVNLQKQFAL
jgi:hypothetical protein